jgi:hypothetical protein
MDEKELKEYLEKNLKVYLELDKYDDELEVMVYLEDDLITTSSVHLPYLDKFDNRSDL